MKNHGMNKFKAGATLRFIAHSDFVKVVTEKKKLTLRERLRVLVKGEIDEARVVPHPELVQFGRFEFFGHPQTVSEAKAEIAERQRQDAMKHNFRKG